MGFSRQEYWSAAPIPPSGDLPNPRIESVSLTSPELAGNSLPVVPGSYLFGLQLFSGNSQEIDHLAVSLYIKSLLAKLLNGEMSRNPQNIIDYIVKEY